jgi:hypothetical protein
MTDYSYRFHPSISGFLYFDLGILVVEVPEEPSFLQSGKNEDFCFQPMTLVLCTHLA